MYSNSRTNRPAASARRAGTQGGYTDEETVYHLPHDDLCGWPYRLRHEEHLPGVQEYYDTLDSLNAPSRVSGRVTAELELAGPRRISQRDRHSLRAGGLFQKDRCRRVRDHCGYKGHTAVGGAGG